MANFVTLLIFSAMCLQIEISTAQQHTNPLFKDHPCKSHQDCVNFANTDCSNGQHCNCKKDFVEVNSECLALGTVSSDCKDNLQCTTQLGSLSRCSPDTRKCECYDTRYNGKNSTTVYRNTCYYRKNLGDRCETSNECMASLSPPQDTFCDTATKVCVCGQGKTCTSNSAASYTTNALSVFVNLALIGFMALGRSVIV